MHHSSRRLFRIQGSRSWKMEVARVFLRLRVLGDTGPMIFCAYIRCSMYIYIVYNDYHIWLLYILYDYYILYMIIIYYIYMSTLIIWLIMIVCFVDFDFLTCLIIPHLEDSKVARMWSSEFTGRRLTLDMSANCFGPHYFFRRINTEVWKHLLRDWICLVYNIHILFGILHGQGASWNLFQRPLLYLLWNSRCSLFWSDVIWMFATPYFKCPVIPVTYLAQDSRLKS